MQNTKSLEDVIHEAIVASGLGTVEEQIALTKAMQDHVSEFIAMMPAVELLHFTRALMSAAMQLAEQHPSPDARVTTALQRANEELRL